MNCYFIGMQMGPKIDFICSTYDLRLAKIIADAVNDKTGLDYAVYSAYGYTQHRPMSECAMDRVLLPHYYLEEAAARRRAMLNTSQGMEGLTRYNDAVRSYG